jgi:excisionase family DNA binding protein
MAPTLIPTAEAAQRLHIDRSTLSRWVALGRISPALRTSERGPMLFDLAEVEALAKRDAA